MTFDDDGFRPKTFDGVAYDPEFDQIRLTKQYDKVEKLMLDRNWRTLKEISSITKAPEASVSALLRDFRKKRNGSQVVEMRSRGARSKGLFEYRLQPKGYTSEWVQEPRRNKQREALEAIWYHKDTTQAQKQVIREIFK